MFWLESRPEEGGRNTLIMWRNGTRSELTPAPFNVRTRVHEYGGGAYLATNGNAYFVNFADQNIYRVPLAGGTPDRGHAYGRRYALRRFRHRRAARAPHLGR